MKKKTFWLDEFKDGKARGVYYFRAFDLVQFLKKLENNDLEVVGLEFDGNNVNVLVKGDE